MQIDYRRLAAGLGIEAGGAHGDAFMQGDDVFDVGIVLQTVQQGTFGGARITENLIHTMGQEAVHEDLSSAHIHLRRYVIILFVCRGGPNSGP